MQRESNEIARPWEGLLTPPDRSRGLLCRLFILHLVSLSKPYPGRCRQGVTRLRRRTWILAMQADKKILQLGHDVLEIARSDHVTSGVTGTKGVFLTITLDTRG